VRVSYSDGEPDTYFVPLAFAIGRDMEERIASGAAAALIRRRDGGETGVVYDALENGAFGRWLLESLSSRRQLRGRDGAIVTTATRALRDALRDEAPTALTPQRMGAERTHSLVAYDERFMLKVFRRLDEGVSPELEVGRFLTTRTAFAHGPTVVGAVEYRRTGEEPLTVGVVQAFVPNVGDAWRYTVDAVAQFFEHLLAAGRDVSLPAGQPGSVVADAPADDPPAITAFAGASLDAARLLGRRTAELHLALGSRTDDDAFAPEPFTPLYQRSLYQSLRAKAEKSLTLLSRRLRILPPDVRERAAAVLATRDTLMAHLRAVSQRRLGGMRIRCHGNYHLGEILFTGRDFVILDFEGEHALSLGQRRMKRSPLVDVAGMLRSFAYAARSALLDGRVRPGDVDVLAPWADVWSHWVGRAFVEAYREAVEPSGLLPRSVTDVRLLLECYQIEKALYEVAYELGARPAWTAIPLHGIQSLLQASADVA